MLKRNYELQFISHMIEVFIFFFLSFIEFYINLLITAWWISHKAIKICFDEQDNFEQPPYSTETVWKAIQEHYNIKTR